MTPTDTQFRLRIPNDLHAKLVENAERNHRSINAEVVARIVTSFQWDSYSPEEMTRQIDMLKEAMGHLTGDVASLRHTLNSGTKDSTVTKE